MDPNNCFYKVFLEVQKLTSYLLILEVSRLVYEGNFFKFKNK